MRRLTGSLLVLVLISCNAAPSATAKLPSGLVGDIARSAAALASGTTADQRLESFLADLDLQKDLGDRAREVTDQIRKARAALAPQSTLGASGGRLASVVAAIGESLTIYFSTKFAAYLDELTKHQGTLTSTPEDKSTVEDGATTVTAATRHTTEVASSTGSRVTMTMSWAYRTVTKDKATGATLVELIDERTVVGGITVCPDASGSVGASLDAKWKLVSTVNTRAPAKAGTSSSVFTGHVDDSASLQSVTQTLHDEQSWDTPSGNADYNSTLTTTYAADASGSFAQGYDATTVSGAASANGPGAEAHVPGAVSWTMILDAELLTRAFKESQRLWRGGRCVMVRVSDYGAETPLEVADQQKTQHDETVDPASETKFAVSLKHRFEGGTPSQPVNAALISGAKTVEPSRIESGSGTATYKAPDEQGKNASVRLQTTSKRGIGTLVLDFDTGGALTLTLTGTATSHLSAFGTTSDQSVQITIGPLEFKKVAGDLYSASGAWRSSVHSVAGNSLGTNTCEGTEQGTIDIDAQTDTRAGNKVWSIKPLSMASADGSGSQTCVNSLGGTTLRGVTLPRSTTSETDGGSAALFLSALDEIVIPSNGGQVGVRGTRNVAGATITAQGTANAMTTK